MKLDVHHVRHLILTATTALGLTIASGCGNGSGGGTTNGGNSGGVPASQPENADGTTTGNTTGGGTGTSKTPDTNSNGGAAPAPNAFANYPASRTNPSPKSPPRSWYDLDIDAWIGKSWKDLELFSFMKTWPKGLDKGKRYVAFYSRTCDHCEDMFYQDFAMKPALAQMVTAVEIPQDRDVMTSPDAWPMPDTQCEHLELPLGAEYVITSPLILRIEDGKITCAIEGSHEKCMELD